jgi:hypothetical protein
MLKQPQFTSLLANFEKKKRPHCCDLYKYLKITVPGTGELSNQLVLDFIAFADLPSNKA